MATIVPSRGGTGRFARDKCLDFVRECGDQERELSEKLWRVDQREEPLRRGLEDGCERNTRE
eukprot:2775439-Karenia_brevis.AAC.1